MLKEANDPVALVDLIDGIGHCINIISDHQSSFFDIISVVLNMNYNSNLNIASALSRLCISLASVCTQYNQIIFNHLFFQLMLLAPVDHAVEGYVSVGMFRYKVIRCRRTCSFTVRRFDS